MAVWWERGLERRGVRVVVRASISVERSARRGWREGGSSILLGFVGGVVFLLVVKLLCMEFGTEGLRKFLSLGRLRDVEPHHVNVNLGRRQLLFLFSMNNS